MDLPQVSRQSTPIFPPEIIEKILDELLTPSTLKSWSLVSRAWTPRAQRRIFYRVDIPISRDGRYLALLENTVKQPERYRHLVAYIKSLSITRDTPWSVGSRTPRPHLSKFLSQLPMLREIDISLPVVSWYDLLVWEREAYTRVFQSPSLRRITVNVHQGFPLSLLSQSSPAVQSFCVGPLGLAVGRRPPLLTPGVPSLRHLGISTIDVTRSLSKFLADKTRNNGFFHSLESIRVTLRPRNIVAAISDMKPFFEHCPSLCRFDVISRCKNFFRVLHKHNLTSNDLRSANNSGAEWPVIKL